MRIRDSVPGLALLLALPAGAEFLRVDVKFEGVGCASCMESLPGRLGRVRGVESVKVDVEAGTAAIELSVGNRVRLGPLVSRIAQDGSKIIRTDVVARGTVADGVFRLDGVKKEYRIEGDLSFEDGVVYRVTGEVAEDGILHAKSANKD